MAHLLPSGIPVKPMVSEDKVDINQNFYAHYIHYIDGESFVRPGNSWVGYKVKEFIPPSKNLKISEFYKLNVKMRCFEHVSVCIDGSADFVYRGYNDEGNVLQVNDTWHFGVNNIENGLGYLPTETFTRSFKNNYKTCCIIPMQNSDKSINYYFEVVQFESPSLVLTKDYVFAHIASGEVIYNNLVYTQKQTIENLKSENTLLLSNNTIIILSYTT